MKEKLSPIALQIMASIFAQKLLWTSNQLSSDYFGTSSDIELNWQKNSNRINWMKSKTRGQGSFVSINYQLMSTSAVVYLCEYIQIKRDSRKTLLSDSSFHFSRTRRGAWPIISLLGPSSSFHVNIFSVRTSRESLYTIVNVVLRSMSSTEV